MLNGGISRIFGKAFAGLYLPATLYARTITYDGEGNPIAADSEYACRAQVDAATEAIRQAAGYTETDRRILVLADGLAVTPNTNDEITVKGQRFAVASVTSDPAESYYELRGQRA